MMDQIQIAMWKTKTTITKHVLIHHHHHQNTTSKEIISGKLFGTVSQPLIWIHKVGYIFGDPPPPGSCAIALGSGRLRERFTRFKIITHALEIYFRSQLSSKIIISEWSLVLPIISQVVKRYFGLQFFLRWHVTQWKRATLKWYYFKSLDPLDIFLRIFLSSYVRLLAF